MKNSQPLTFEPGDEFTIETVRECISHMEGTNTHRALNGMIDCWYGIAKSRGESDKKAALFALDELGRKIIELSKRMPK